MIRINLLGVERAKVKKRVAFQVGQKLTLACSLILIVTALFLGWRFWTVSRESAKLDADIAQAQSETSRLHSIITQVQQYEQRRAQLQQRVTLIEQLRKEQTGPVHMLDQISRALPSMVWLTDLKQTGTPNEVEIDGRCINETMVSDFVANLEGSGYFKRSIDVTNTTTESTPQPPGTVVKFALKATFQPPDAAKPAAPGAAKTGAAN
ncbi:MAG TPA: PilN domain-containing protein [Vicinamibacterales bacterium]|jgi:type IV pilus assembly protein PilN|nr:PilN domain-containing protein [Vicinamibacterales bacterium]